MHVQLPWAQGTARPVLFAVCRAAVVAVLQVKAVGKTLEFKAHAAVARVDNAVLQPKGAKGYDVLLLGYSAKQRARL